MESIEYSECLKEMFALARFGIKLELDTTQGILERIGSPEKKFKSIHIAGTNGKGSIASYIASILRCSGFKVGLYTSPHLVKFNERFCINGEMVSDEDIIESYHAVHNADTGERKATFFEISTTMAFYLFAKHKVDWAVIETGMGGRLDATNVLQPELSVISNLSLEHTEYLGNTIEEIAAEKGGIIKRDTPIVTGVNNGPALEVLKKIALERNATIYIYEKDFSSAASSTDPSMVRGTRFTYNGMKNSWKEMQTTLSGPHQIMNASIALAACELLMKQSPEMITDSSIKKGLRETRWPGRLEYIMESPTVVIDGAHNLDAAENLGRYLKSYHSREIRSLSAERSGSKLTLIIGILSDKPYREMLTYFLPEADRIIFTKAKIDRSLDPERLKDYALTVTECEMSIIEDVGEAVEYAVKNSATNDIICIAGSLYVAGEARDKILKDFRLQP